MRQGSMHVAVQSMRSDSDIHRSMFILLSTSRRSYSRPTAAKLRPETHLAIIFAGPPPQSRPALTSTQAHAFASASMTCTPTRKSEVRRGCRGRVAATIPPCSSCNQAKTVTLRVGLVRAIETNSRQDRVVLVLAAIVTVFVGLQLFFTFISTSNTTCYTMLNRYLSASRSFS
jgi:hypothetical protein